MGESSANLHVSDDAWTSATHPRLCPHCQADMRWLPASARFCPKCGWDRQACRDSESTSSHLKDVAPTLTASDLHLDLDAGAASPPPLPPLAKAMPQRSPLLRGFATALYRLGLRYEGSLGARHHPAEAERCYFKAAKLGHPGAIARVGNSPLPADDSASSLPADG